MWSSPDDDGDTAQGKVEENYGWTKQTFDIGLPALIGMIADPVLSLVDTGFVGRLGAVPLAALGACTSIFHLAFNCFRATTTATTSLVATSLSTAGRDEEENREEARIVVDTSIRLGLTIGVLVLVALSLGWSYALGAMGIGSDSALLQPAQSYLRIRALAAPAVLLISVAEGAFRGYGNTRIPLLASFIAAITNLVLDPIFMFSMKMKVGGAAAATALSQMAAAAVYTIFLRRRKMVPRNVSGQGKSSINRAKIVVEILRANAAMLAKQGSLLFGWAYATARATRIGHYHVAAHQIALSLWLIFALVWTGRPSVRKFSCRAIMQPIKAMDVPLMTMNERNLEFVEKHGVPFAPSPATCSNLPWYKGFYQPSPFSAWASSHPRYSRPTLPFACISRKLSRTWLGNKF